MSPLSKWTIVAERRPDIGLPQHPYLVRPKRLPGEGLSAWLNRHYLMNGLTLPRRVRSLMIQSYRHRRDPVVRVHALDQINRLFLGEAQIQPERWVAWCFEQPPTSSADWQSSSRRYYPHGFCPTCLGEWGYFLELWEIPLVTACPRHGVMLESICSACGHDRGDWAWEEGRYQCRCGVPLKEFASRPADRMALAWSSSIAAHSGISLPPGYLSERQASLAVSPMQLQFARVLTTPWTKTKGRLDAYRLLFEWPEYPRTFLCRWVRQIFIGDDSPTKLVTGNGTIAFEISHAQRMLRRMGADIVESALRAELGRHSLFVFEDAALFVNPSLVGGAGALRQSFACWWRSIDWGDHHDKNEEAVPRQLPCRFHRPLVVRCLMSLLRLSETHLPADRLHRIRDHWCPASSIRRATDPVGLMDAIARDLYGLHLEPLRGLADCLESLAKESLGGSD